MAPVNSGVHTGNNFSENHAQFQHMTTKKFASPLLDRKTSTNIVLERRQFISINGLPNYTLPGAPTYLVPVLIWGYNETCLQQNHKVNENFVETGFRPSQAL
jgi:hypothetical protein